MATLITKNSSTTTSVPIASQLVQGELAVNVTDKRLFTEDSGGAVVEVGTNPSSLTLLNGTANGVAYLNGSKVLTSGTALTFDGSNLGLGVTPSNAYASAKSFEGTSGQVSFNGSSVLNLTQNAYYNAAGAFLYKNTAAATLCQQTGGAFYFYNALSGTAGNAITFTQAMTLHASGGLSLGNTTDPGVGTLNVNGLTVGRGAGAVATNTAVGASALAANTTGSNNTAAGYLALSTNITGANNSAFGLFALRLNTGASNSAFGVQALDANTGSSNSAFGQGALQFNTTASNNTAVGHQAGYANTTGANLNVFGYQSGYSNTTGSNNSAFGDRALRAVTTTSSNSAFGALALYANTGAANSAFGAVALYENTTGNYNTAIGEEALRLNTTASNNTAVGYQAGYFITTGTKNSILGSYTGNQGGLDIRTANNHIVLSDGDGNPRQIIDSSGNLGLGVTPSAWSGFVGSQVGALGSMNLGGSVDDSFIGSNVYYNAGFKFARPTTGTYATMYRQSGGVHSWNTSTAVGTAGNAITFTQAMTLDASGNLLVGTTSGTTARVRIETDLAPRDGLDIKNTANNTANTFVAFINYNNALAGSISQPTATSVTYNVTSDYRLKTVVGAVSGQGARIDALKPIDYTWTEDGAQARGFLAHEFQEVYSNSVTGEKDAVDDEGKPKYQAMQAATSEVIADLVAEIQSLRKRLTALEAK